MGREAQEAKLQKQLEKLRKKAKSKPSKTKKPLKMDRESVEKRRQAKLEEIRLQRKAEKQMKSIKAELKKLNQPKGLYSKDKLEKLQMFGKKKKSKPKVTEMGLINDKMVPIEEYNIIMDTRRALGKNKGGMMQKKNKKTMGYLKGGQVKLDKNKDGKISGADFKMMNKGGMMPKNKNYGKAYGKAYRAGGMTIKVVSCGASRKPTQKGTPKGKSK